MKRLAILAVVACTGGADQSASAQDVWRTDFSRSVVPISEIISGGPGKDGIPAIDKPEFVTVGQADRWLDGREPVLLIEHRGLVRAYPLRILLWHEIVNDKIGDLPIAVTYCPLCNTALVFDRRHRGLVLDFGTTGRLRNSDLVMYDRQTESWWQQASGEGLFGKFAGDTLRFLPAGNVSWNTVKREHPRAQVLSQNTGYDRPYGNTPYAGYDAPGGAPMAGFFRGRKDERLPAMERVVAVQDGGKSAAYPFSVLRERGVVNDIVGRRKIAVFWTSGTTSALDRRSIRESRDVGSAGVFDRELDGKLLTFEASGEGRFQDRETRSTWSLLGRGVAGPLKGRQLRRIVSGDYLWFAWAVFQPNTRVWR